jgi:hypothetical protein
MFRTGEAGPNLRPDTCANTRKQGLRQLWPRDLLVAICETGGRGTLAQPRSPRISDLSYRRSTCMQQNETGGARAAACGSP